jgi:hypothetical protein
MPYALIPQREREVGLRLRELAAELGISSSEIVLTAMGYSVPPALAEAYGGPVTSQNLFAEAPTPMAVLPKAVGGPVCFTKPGVVDLCVYRGDSGRVRVRVNDTAGLPVDVSGATWDCDFRSTLDAETVLCSPAIEPVDGITNAVDIVLSPECSASLDDDCVWDLEMSLGGEVTTILAGRVLVTKDVSRT